MIDECDTVATEEEFCVGNILLRLLQTTPPCSLYSSAYQIQLELYLFFLYFVTSSIFSN
jgi:hypothetical protein